MSKIAIITGFVLMCTALGATADTIVLKSGRTIETQGTWEENGTVKYFKDGAIADGVPRALIERIETTSEQAPRPADPSRSEPKLLENVTHRNQIERAGKATLSIKTVAGSGSGFFITSNGYILTNRHVIRGDEKRLAALEKSLDAAHRRLEKAGDALAKERRRLEKLEKQIETDPRYDNPNNVDLLKDAWQRYETNYTIYKKRKLEVGKKSRDFHNLKAKLLVRRSIRVILVDGRELSASIERISDRLDLALLRIPSYETPYIRPGRVRDIAQGTRLYAIGNPLNFSHSVSAGVFSGHQKGMLMTSAPINAGNSGGPLITENGEVVGINTMKMVGQGVEGLGFAIPIHVALAEFRDILSPHLDNR